MKVTMNYYDILGISKQATPEEIKKAYNKIAKQSHPDTTKDLSENEQIQKEQQFILATEAYQTLKNVEKRNQYDIELTLQQVYERKNRKESSKDEFETENKRETESQKTYQSNKNYHNKNPKTNDQNNTIWSNFRKAYKYQKKKEKEFDIRIRKIINELFPHSGRISRGILLFLGTSYENFNKLKLKRNDDIYRYTIRNRKNLTFLIAAMLIIANQHTQEEVTVANTINYEQESSQDSLSETITIIRDYTIKAGDTLSELAEDANCKMSEIKSLNDMYTDNIYYNSQIKIPYHISQDDLAEYVTISSYNGENLHEYAKNYETTIESLIKLNPNDISMNYDTYIVSKDTLITPNFKTYEKEITKIK